MTEPPKQERFTNAVVFGGFLDAACRLGLQESICQKAPPELVAMFQKRPLPTVMVPGWLCDKFYEAVVAATGRAALRDIAHQSMRERGGQMLRSMFASMIALFGKSPEALFSQVAMIMSPVVANIELNYIPESPRSGKVTIRPQGRPAPLSYAIWEGYFEYFFDVCEAQGTVEQAVLSDDGLMGTVLVHW